MLSIKKEVKKKKKATDNIEVLSWMEKKSLADKEEEALGKDIEEFRTWTNMIDSMGDEQLKEYLKKRPDNMKTVMVSKSAPTKRERDAKSKASTSNTIMASVWKFHQEEDDETSAMSSV